MSFSPLSSNPSRTGPDPDGRAHSRAVGFRVVAGHDRESLASLRSIAGLLANVICEVAGGADAGPESCPHQVGINGYFPGVVLRGDAVVASCDDGRLAGMLAGLGDLYQDIGARWRYSAVVNAEADPSAPLAGSFVSAKFWDQGLVDVAVADQLALRLVDVLVEAGNLPGIRTGYVNADGEVAPYWWLTRDRWTGSVSTMEGHVHGYYWTVLLRQRHIAELGGMRSVVENAPAFAAIAIEGAGENAIVVRSTRSLADRTEHNVRAWREFLQPVLPPGFPVGEIEEPVWLFEGPTLSEDVADAMIHLPQPERSSVEVDIVGQPIVGATARFRVKLKRSDQSEVGHLQAIVNAWAIAGRHGMFGGHLRGVSEVSVQLSSGEEISCEWTADLGSCVLGVEHFVSALHGRVHEIEYLGVPLPYMGLAVEVA
jgi:hypothetical protein